MTDEPQWLMRVEGALSAHFKQPDGSSRPGTDWAIGLKHGDDTYKVMVRAYLSDDITQQARADTRYQAETVMGFLNDMLSRGWTPDQEGKLELTILNPLEEEGSGEGNP